MYSKEPFKRIHTYFMLNQNFNVQFTPFNLADRRSLQNTQGMFFSRVLRDSTPRYVGRSVGRLLPFWAAAPKGSMTYAFTHMGNFRLLLGLEFGSRGWDLRGSTLEEEKEKFPRMCESIGH